MKQKIIDNIKRLYINLRQYFLNWHFVLCFGFAWLITNGWSYIALAIGTAFKWTWLISVASAYLALLWVPFTPEKLITVMLAMVFMKAFFPGDKNALELLEKARKSIQKKRKAGSDPAQEDR